MKNLNVPADTMTKFKEKMNSDLLEYGKKKNTQIISEGKAHDLVRWLKFQRSPDNFPEVKISDFDHHKICEYAHEKSLYLVDFPVLDIKDILVMPKAKGSSSGEDDDG